MKRKKWGSHRREIKGEGKRGWERRWTSRQDERKKWRGEVGVGITEFIKLYNKKNQTNINH